MMKESGAKRDEAMGLIEALCQDTITAGGMAHLESLVLANPAVRSLYVRYLHMHASLPLFVRDRTDGAFGASDEAAIMAELEAMAGAVSDMRAAPGETDSAAMLNFGQLQERTSIFETRRKRRSRTSLRLRVFLRRMMHIGGESPVAVALMWMVMAICLSGTVLTCVFIGMMVFGAKPPTVQPDVARSGEPEAGSKEQRAANPAANSSPVARLVRLADCRWEDDSPALAAGDDLLNGSKLMLKSGLAEIIFQGGAKTVLEGPATLEIRSRTGAFLRQGKFTVAVENPLARGFAVYTPGMKYTDLGTAFGVCVAKDGTQEMHVFRGKVQAEQADETDNGEREMGKKEERESPDSSSDSSSPLLPRPAQQAPPPTTPLILTANEAVRVAGAGKPIERVAYNEERFVRTTFTPSPFPIFGTGVNLDRGAADPHWEITEISTISSFKPQPAVVAVPNIGYAPDNRNIAQWISSREAIGDLDMPVGCRWTLRTHFDLTGFDPSTARIAVRIVVDNFLAGVRLNGEALQLPEGSRDRRLYVNWLALKIEKGFAAGDNILEIEIENGPFETASSVPNPMAMCLELKGTAMRRPAAKTD
jgi:hypothetical protein